VTAGDNPERLRSEAAWAHLCGVSPLQASSGQVTRHRHNRCGDRQANRALWIIVISRLSRRGNRKLNHALHMAAICQISQKDSKGRVYFERKITEDKTKREAIRSLERQISNAAYRQLVLDAERGPGGH